MAENKFLIHSEDMVVNSQEADDAFAKELFDTYVAEKNMELSQEELNTLTLTEGAKLWEVYIDSVIEKAKTNTASENAEICKKLENLGILLADKLLKTDEIHCLFNKKTGKPHLIAQVCKSPDGRYNCSAPDIFLMTKPMSDFIMARYSKNPDFEVKTIKSDEINDFLNKCFNIYGAEGFQINGQYAAIDAEIILPKLNIKKNTKLSISNPDLMRWIILSAQVGMPSNEAEELAVALYNSFSSKELISSKFMLPIYTGKSLKGMRYEELMLNGKKVKTPVITSPSGKEAFLLYTDWGEFNTHYDESWGAAEVIIEDLIASKCVLINMNEKYKAFGIQLDQEMYDAMKMTVTG